MGTKNEVKEIQILSDEQIKALPDTVKENVVFLTENMPPKELMVLNPLVTTLLDLREKADKLKLEKEEDGSFKKDSIKEYKEVKAEQRSFNGTLKKTAKEMKDPINKIRAGIIEIEKTFKAESDQIKEDFEEKFAEYEKEQAEKARIAKEKKDAAMNAEIEKANEETEKLRLQQKKMNMYNDIRNVEINQKITDRVADAIEESNESTLERLQAEIAQKTWENTVPPQVDELDDEVIAELISAFDKAKNRAVESINARLVKYEEEREKLQKEAQEKAKKQQDSVPQHMMHTSYEGTEPQQIEVPLKVTDEDRFIEKVLERIEALELAVDIRIKHEGLTPELKKLKECFLKFNS